MGGGDGRRGEGCKLKLSNRDLIFKDNGYIIRQLGDCGGDEDDCGGVDGYGDSDCDGSVVVVVVVKGVMAALVVVLVVCSLLWRR